MELIAVEDAGTNKVYLYGIADPASAATVAGTFNGMGHAGVFCSVYTGVDLDGTPRSDNQTTQDSTSSPISHTHSGKDAGDMLVCVVQGGGTPTADTGTVQQQANTSGGNSRATGRRGDGTAIGWTHSSTMSLASIVLEEEPAVRRLFPIRMD
ncbi:MAG: hypothetical protein ACXABY_18595 [Candidatus Thorarchaeota archaeon]|jgi:hypothetical protein